MEFTAYKFIDKYDYSKGWDSFALDYSKMLQPDTVYHLTKELMYKIVENHIDFSANSSVLDIGCGTGNDFPFFLKKGSQITGCDYSKGMLNKASEIYAEDINSSKISLLLGSLEDLDSTTFEHNSFDLIFSITGGLSYIDDTLMKEKLSEMKKFLKPNGKIIMAHFSRFCLAESLFNLKRLKLKSAFVRLRSQIKVGIKGEEFTMHLRSTNSVKNIIKDDFIIDAVYPLLMFTPPYQTKYNPSLKRLEKHRIKEFKNLDNRFLANFSDQFVTVLSKK